MAYEYNLQRLFLPPIESLPIEEQLARYRQRDLVPSHLYRLGTNLFGRSSLSARHRVFDAEHLSLPKGVNHQALLKKSLDGRTVPDTGTLRKREKEQRKELCKGRVVRSLSEQSIESSDSEAEYKKWVTERKTLRTTLDNLGASERWLLSKERTPLETSLLTKIRHESRKSDAESAKLDVQLSEEISDFSGSTSIKSPNPRRTLQKLRRQMIREITHLEGFIASNRRRVISLLAVLDKAHTRFVTFNEMLSVLSKLKAPLSQTAIETLIQVLEIREDGLLDYQQLVSGGIHTAVAEHFERLEAELVIDKDDKQEESTVCEDEWILKAASMEKKYGAPSTLQGEHKHLSEFYKQDEVKQFSKLINYCKENGIVLNWQLAEKALLIPPDRPRQECLRDLRQAGLSLLSKYFAESPQEQAQRKQKDTYEGFGKAYKELRGERKAKYMRLSTGGAKVKAKTDCWLSFEEYLELTEHIRSKPGFKYKDHGLPDNNAFWPGAMLDKLRLWMPRESLLDKPYSLYNVFQPVQHPKIYNPFSPMVEQRMAWPENESGYVQFGSQDRKQYQL